NGVNDQLRQLGFQLGRCSKAHAAPRCFLDGANHLRMRVAQDQWTPGADKIQVLIAVDIEEERSLAASDKRRIAAYCAERGRRTVDASRDHPASAIKGLSTSAGGHLSQLATSRAKEGR